MTNGNPCLASVLEEDKEGWRLWKTEGRTHVPAEGGSSTQIQPKLALCCQIFQFWNEVGYLNFCGKSLEFEILVANLNISKCLCLMPCLVGGLS